jgi:hypothetical protein
MLEIFKLTRLGYYQLYQDARNFLQSKYEQADQVFTTASPYGQLLEVVLDLGRLIFYYIEDSVQELNIYTAQRPNSIRGLARIAGHNPTRPVAASGTIRLTYSGAKVDMYGNTAVIPNFTTLVCQTNGLTYTVILDQEAVSIDLSGKNSIDIPIIQGAIEAQTFTGDGEELQSFTTTPKKNFNIDNFYVKVYVNNEEWGKYESLYDIPYEANGCIVKTGIDSGIDVYFGNGYFGKMPPLGSIVRIEYLTTSGNAGNLLVDENPTYKFLDSGYDIAGDEVDLNKVLTIVTSVPVTFGTDAEPLYLTKLLAPKTSRAYVLANTDNYVYFLQKFNFFSVIDAFTTLGDENIEDDNVVYLFLVPDVNKRKKSSDNYFTIPTNLFLLTDGEKTKIYDLIEKSGQKLMTVVNKIIEPTISKYVMFVNITAYEGYNKDVIRQNITTKCSEYFLSNRRRDRIPKSDIISVIETVEGVDSVNVYFVSEKNEEYKKIPANSDKKDIGLDEFGDIIMDRGELAIVRGGWANRYGQYFNPGIDPGKPSTLNITFSKKDTPRNLNMSLHRVEVNNIKKTV